MYVKYLQICPSTLFHRIKGYNPPYLCSQQKTFKLNLNCTNSLFLLGCLRRHWSLCILHIAVHESTTWTVIFVCKNTCLCAFMGYYANVFIHVLIFSNYLHTIPNFALQKVSSIITYSTEIIIQYFDRRSGANSISLLCSFKRIVCIYLLF